jgi:hypothetical protein
VRIIHFEFTFAYHKAPRPQTSCATDCAPQFSDDVKRAESKCASDVKRAESKCAADVKRAESKCAALEKELKGAHQSF